MNRPLREIVDDIEQMERALELMSHSVTAPGRLFHQMNYEEAYARVCADIPEARVGRLEGFDIVTWLRWRLKIDVDFDKPETGPSDGSIA